MKEKLPTPAELRHSLDLLGTNDPIIKKLRMAYELADKAYEKFTETDKRYLKLKRAAESARHAYYLHERKERDTRVGEINKVRQLIYNLGSTPRTIKAVIALCEKYGATTEQKWPTP